MAVFRPCDRYSRGKTRFKIRAPYTRRRPRRNRDVYFKVAGPGAIESARSNDEAHAVAAVRGFRLTGWFARSLAATRSDVRRETVERLHPTSMDTTPRRDVSLTVPRCSTRLWSCTSVIFSSSFYWAHMHGMHESMTNRRYWERSMSTRDENRSCGRSVDLLANRDCYVRVPGNAIASDVFIVGF